jgi:hypothetical protein
MDVSRVLSETPFKPISRNNILTFEALSHRSIYRHLPILERLFAGSKYDINGNPGKHNPNAK